MKNKIAAIILGAGLSERMDGYPKPIIKYKKKYFAEYIYENILKCGIEDIFFITGFKSEIVKKHLSHLNKLFFIKNNNYNDGQFSSLLTGLNFIIKKNISPDYILITLSDLPFINFHTYELLVKSVEKERFIIPSYDNKRGHPVIFDSSYIIEFLNEPVWSSAKNVVNKNKDKIKYITVDDMNILHDFDYKNQLSSEFEFCKL